MLMPNVTATVYVGTPNSVAVLGVLPGATAFSRSSKYLSCLHPAAKEPSRILQFARECLYSIPAPDLPYAAYKLSANVPSR